ncbi:hypothetical protein LCGC14_3012530 [marine sediment metagenome]|uniref:Uncharacterized protein n=1 Tax=marine sediment metagenome TaxID=412755 RepID=A0A0F8Z5E6_9ZZZZ
MTKITLLIDGEQKLEKELQHIEPEQIVKTFEMVMDYAALHKGNKINMLKGLQGLR